MALKVVQSLLPQSTLYGPPENVYADRDGDQVTVSWDEVWMTEDDYRGYLIEATVCQGGNLVWQAVSVDARHILTDEDTCGRDRAGSCTRWKSMAMPRSKSGPKRMIPSGDPII
jgi:hypothetical protein